MRKCCRMYIVLNSYLCGKYTEVKCRRTAFGWAAGILVLVNWWPRCVARTLETSVVSAIPSRTYGRISSSSKSDWFHRTPTSPCSRENPWKYRFSHRLALCDFSSWTIDVCLNIQCWLVHLSVTTTDISFTKYLLCTPRTHWTSTMAIVIVLRIMLYLLYMLRANSHHLIVWKLCYLSISIDPRSRSDAVRKGWQIRIEARRTMF
jgi:hypothetical protein